MDFISHSENALVQELNLEPPPLPPEVLFLPEPPDPDHDRSLELAGSDLLLGC